MSSAKRLKGIKSLVHGFELFEVTAGKSIFIPPNRWHAAVNVSGCFSLNISVCPRVKLLPCIITSVEDWRVLVAKEGKKAVQAYRYGKGIQCFIDACITELVLEIRALNAKNGVDHVLLLPHGDCQRMMHALSQLMWLVANVESNIVVGCNKDWQKKQMSELKKHSCGALKL